MTNAITVEVTSNAGAIAKVNPFNALVLADWIKFCDVKPATQVTYNKAIQCFIGYITRNEIEKPVRDDVVAFRDWLIDENGGDYKASTARLYITVCKKFFRWLASKMIYANVADGVKLPKVDADEHQRDALSLEEAKAAIAHVDEKANKEMQLRNRAVISLMIGCGLRTIEIVRLNEGDLEKRCGQWFINVLGKGKDTKKSVQITPELKKILDDYRSIRGEVKNNSAMFISTARSNFGKRLQTQTISRLVKKTFKAIGSDSSRVVAHSCRHTFCTLALKAGLAIREVQKAMRHSSASTTEIYSHDLNKFNNKTFKVVTKLLFF